jgi:hypothetical protein
LWLRISHCARVRFLGAAALIVFLTIATVCRADAPDERELWNAFDEFMGVSDGWESTKEADGIRVYLRDVDVSPIKSFRGVIEMETSLAALAAFLMDTEMAPEYVTVCERATILRRVSDTEVYMHSVNRPGWPVAPRDSIVHCKWSQDSQTLAVTERCVGVPDYLPAREGFVRVPLITTLLKLTPRGNGRVEVILEAVAEAGGWLPNWLINTVLVDTPFSTLSRIRNRLPFTGYEGRQPNWLQEPPRHNVAQEIAGP